MKNKLLLLLGILAIVGCTKDLQEEVTPDVVKASYEPDRFLVTSGSGTKASMTSDGQFSMKDGDKLMVYGYITKDEYGQSLGSAYWHFSPYEFYNDNEENNASWFVQEENSAPVHQKYWAVYPASITGNLGVSDALIPNYDDGVEFAVTLPSTYEVKDSENLAIAASSAPLFGKFSENYDYDGTDPQFTHIFYMQHMAGGLYLNLGTVSAGTKKFVISTPGKPLSGKFTARTPKATHPKYFSDDDKKAITLVDAGEGGSESITIELETALSSNTELAISIPIPAGDYNDVEVNMYNAANVKIGRYILGKGFSIPRGKLGRINKLNVVTTIVVTDLGSNKTIELPSTDKGVAVDFTGANSGNYTIKYNTKADSQKPSKVFITKGTGSISINMEGELQNSTIQFLQGSYNSASFKSAENTIVVDEEASVGTVNIQQGNIKVEGTINTINVPQLVTADGIEKPVQVNLASTARVENIVIASKSDVTVEQPKDKIEVAAQEYKVQVTVNAGAENSSVTAQNGGAIYVQANASCTVVSDGKSEAEVSSSVTIAEITSNDVVVEYSETNGGTVSANDSDINSQNAIDISDKAARIGETYYLTLAAAFEAVENGQTITLLNDATTLPNNIVVGGTYGSSPTTTTAINPINITLDLNNHNITSDKTIYLAGGSLNIVGKGTIETTGSGVAAVGVRYVKSGTGLDYTSKRTLNIGSSVTLKGAYGLNVFGTNEGTIANDIEVNVNGKIEGDLFILGNLTNADNKININVNGTIAATGNDKTGIALNGNANVVVGQNASVSGPTGIEVRAGSLTINGGTIRGTASPGSVKPNGSGTTTKGAGIAVSQHTTKCPINVSIENGTIEGHTGLYVVNPQNNNAEDLEKVNVSISGGNFNAINNGVNSVCKDNNASSAALIIVGGKFNSDPAEYVPAGLEAVPDSDVKFWTIDNLDYMARIGENLYKSLGKAISAAKSGDVITILASHTVNQGYTIDKDLTIDLNGKTITANAASAEDYNFTNGKNRLFHVEGEGVGFTLKGGRVVLNEHMWGSIRFISHGELTLTDYTTSNCREWGANIKMSYGHATFTNVIINADKGGCVDIGDGASSANPSGAVAEMTNCTFNQTNEGSTNAYKEVSAAIICSYSGHVTLNSGTYSGYYGLFPHSSGGTIIVKEGCTVTGRHNAVHTVDHSYTSTQDDHRIYIKGGTINGTFDVATDGYTTFSITGGTFDHDPSAYVAEGYEAVDNGDETWTVHESGMKAEIGSTKYTSLAAAIAAVPTDGTKTTIRMIANEEMATGTALTIASTKNVVLDLNGKTVTGNGGLNGANFFLLTNNGILEITDSSTGKNGKITGYWTNPNTSYTNQYNTIYNLGGKLKLSAGTVETTSGYLSYAVNTSSNAWGTGDDKESEFNMTGGTITSEGDAGLRVYQNCSASPTPYSHNTVNISGGTIAKGGIFLDSYIYNPNANTTGSGIEINVTISGGEIHGLIDMKLRHAFNTTFNITGGTFVDSKLWVRKYSSEWNSAVAEPTEPIFFIRGGNFTFVQNKAFGLAYDCSGTSWESYNNPYSITGGTFNVNPPALFVATGYAAANNGNGTWTVNPSQKVAQIGSVKYETLAAAVAAAKEGDTIQLLSDLDFSQAPYADYKWASTYNPLEICVNSLTLDLNGHTISNMGNTAIVAGHILARDGRISNFTIKNGTLLAGKTDNVTNSYVLGIAGVDGATIKNVTTDGGINVYTGSTNVIIEDCSVNGTKYYTICAQSGSDVTIRGNNFTKNTDASVANPSMFWVAKAGTDSDCETANNPEGSFGPSSIVIESGTYTVKSSGAFYLSGYLKPSVKGGTFNFDPSACVVSGYEAVNNGDGTWTVGPQTTWSGTIPTTVADLPVDDIDDTIIYIYSADQLAQLAYNVNNGTSYEGKIVKLMYDIDLDNKAWVPIGLGGNSAADDKGSEINCFPGTFDGQGHTISNLNVTHNNGDRSFAGLFGNITVTTNKTVTIKDVTVSGVTVASQHMAAGILGRYCGANASAGLVIEGCSVVGTADKNTITSTPFENGEFVESGNQAAGIVGNAYGSGSITIRNCSVSDVNINGTRDLGGIAGAFLPSGNNVTFTGNSVSNSTINQSYPSNIETGKDMTTVHEIVGRTGNWSVPLGNTSNNVTINLYGVARIGSTRYGSLADAIAAVPTDGTKTTIKMLANETMATGATLEVASTKNIVLDLNGCTITGNGGVNRADFKFFTNRGTLEITDSKTGGKITGYWTDPDPSYGSTQFNTIYNIDGKLTLTAGTVETTTGYLSYAINNSSNAWGVGDDKETVFTMTGGTVTAPSGDAAVRVYQNCGSNSNPYSHNTLNISGGLIKDSGIFIDTYIYKANPASSGDHINTTINISGGEIHGLIDLKMRHPYNTTVNVTGGSFRSSTLRVRKYVTEWGTGLAEPTEPVFNISNGDFQFSGSSSSDAFAIIKSNEPSNVWTSYANQYSITGGTFNVDPSTYVAAGYESYQDGNVWKIREATGPQYWINYAAASYESVDETNKVITIANAAQLAKLAKDVRRNESTNYQQVSNFEGYTIRLVADIDLSGKIWFPIGADNTWSPEEQAAENANPCYNSWFRGTFDGNGKTIRNMHAVHEENAGLFGCAVYATFTNIKVEDFEIESNHFAGGVIAWIEVGAKAPSITNCTVKNGTITSSPILIGNAYDNGDKAGGICGFLDTGANRPVTFSGNTVENVNITAYRDFGGLLGYGKYATVSGNTVKDVNLYQNNTNAYKSGTITTFGPEIGRNENNTSTASNNILTNVKMYTGVPGAYTEVISSVAQIGNTGYDSLADAIAAVPTDGTKTTITMLANETMATGATLEVASTKNIVLDLNGCTITGNGGVNRADFKFFTNRGTLEITDSKTGGKITGYWTDPDPSYGSTQFNTIYNIDGKLTLTAGTVETTTGYLSYAINNSSNAWGVGDDKETVFTMTGGTINAPAGDAALRVYQNCAQSATPYSHNIVNISGGTIAAGGIFLDNYIYNPNVNTTGEGINTNVTISGGEIHGLIDLKLRHAYNTTLNITGGTFEGSKLWVRKHGEWNSVTPEPTLPIVFISGGNFSFVNGKAFGLAYDCGASSWTSYTKPYSVTGGTFNVDPAGYVALGYAATGTGPWTVAAMPNWIDYAASDAEFAAATNGTEISISSAALLAKFAKNVNEGVSTYNGYTINLTADIDLAGKNWTPVGVNVQNGNGAHRRTFEGTFEGNNKTISNLYCYSTEDKPLGLFGYSYAGPSYIQNLTLSNVFVYGVHQVGAIIGNSNNVHIDNCKVSGGSVTTTPRLTAKGYDDGNQAGGIAGLVFSVDWNKANGLVTNSTVENLTIKAYRDAGGIAGCSQNGSDGSTVSITGNTVENCTVIADQTSDYVETKDFNANEIVGRYISGTVESNTATNVTIQTIPHQ